RWIGYLEQICARVEVRLKPGSADGVACIGLTSAESSMAKKMIVLGLTESALRSSVGTAILGSDLFSLAQGYGFHLASDDQSRLEFEARWIIDALDRELILSTPETDFSGDAQAPSWLWMNGSLARGEEIAVSIPKPTRWDEIQMAAALKADELAELPIDDFAKGSLKSLSPSKIEAYLECPFIYAAKHVFALADVNELDLEIDPMRRGSFMHAVFERLTEEPFRTSYSPAELDALLDETKTKAEFSLADERLWPSMRAKYADLSRRFLDLEADYRKRFPNAKTAAREIVVTGFVDPKTGELSKTESKLEFKGRIDRIDEDNNGNVVVFDYKSSDSSAAQFASWIKKNKVQLLLYSLAVENGLTELGSKNVVGAIYYVSRPFSRDRGFMLKSEDQGLYSTDQGKKRNLLELDQKEPFFAEARELIAKAVDGIQSGRFQPEPLDPKKCTECRWSTLCRTPHLS
ncbi:MAG TPA: PD-(D/E)XK nuclease family protein, partial [Bdellovibrionales bacterium]|nr:PD-(D/E)XK nuclease family protein [Bdellovibrionales bacterium]